MAKIPIILEPGRADGKLIKTNSVYDDNQEKFLSDKIKEIDDNHNTLKDNVNTLTEIVNNNKTDIENKLETEKNRATNAENNLRETVNNITNINEHAATAELITVNTLPNSTVSNAQQALDDLYKNIIYDVSQFNGGIVFKSLSALLNSPNLSTLIPTSVQHGGMGIRFIQGSVESSDNKYMQYRLKNQSWSADIDDWQEINSAEFSTGEKVNEIGIDDEPTSGSDNLIRSGGVKKIIDKKTEFVESTNILESDEKISFTSDDEKEEYTYIDKNGLHAKNIYDFNGVKYNRDYNRVSHVGDSTSGSMNSHGTIAGILKYYLDSLGKYEFFGFGRGGESTDAMMAYMGSGPMLLNNKITIPTSGSITFIPRCSLIDANGKPMFFAGFSQFGNENGRVPIKNVSIGGIQGTIMADTATRMAGVVFYNAQGNKVASYTQDDYAKDISGLSINAVKMRVCINAHSQSDIDNASCHVSINSVAIELKKHINIANTYLNNNGGLVSSEGYYTSEEIDISSIGTITNLYIDGLANNIAITFTRDSAGESIIVEKGSYIDCNNYTIAKEGVIVAYINNFRKTGIDIADDWASQMHTLLGYTKDKRYLLGSSHYFGNDYTTDEIEKIECRLKKEFGFNYFSGYEYLKDCGLSDLIRFNVMTQQKIDDAIADPDCQNLPEWQRPFANPTYHDFLHFNKYASYLIARKFITMGISLGYWEDGDYSFNTLVNEN